MSTQISRRSLLKSLALLSLTPLLSTRLRLPETTGGLSQANEKPSVLILVFDALSAKHMSLYGYDRETTPHLARFAERATVYHAHYASGNYTTPGTASLLTGTYPWSHRALNLWGAVAKSHVQRNLFRVLGSENYNTIVYTHNAIANVLLNQFRQDIDHFIPPKEFFLFENQFLYPAFSDDASMAYLSEDHLLDISRDHLPGSLFLSMASEIRFEQVRSAVNSRFADAYPRGVPRLGNMFFLLDHVMKGIEGLIGNARQPFLAYFHLLPPHETYSPRRDFVDLFDDGWTPLEKPSHFFDEGKSDEFLNQKRREYDEYIAYTDAEFGRLCNSLAQTGVLEDAYLVVTSDHGEMFERGIIQHNTPTLYEPVIRIPLLISRPGQRRREDVYTPTSCVDLLPTFLWITGREIPDWCEGQVLPKFGGEQAHDGRSIFSVEAKQNPAHALLTKATVALIRDRYKLIHYFGYDGYENEYELYDLANDPHEMEDLHSSGLSVAADLQHQLTQKLREVNQQYSGSRK
jgi:arylsulfatase A-like enzyme